MYDIITFGSATQDITVNPKKLTVLKYNKDFKTGEGICFPLGSKIDVQDITFTTGGGGTNTAATFVKQGFKTAFCGVVGTDLAHTIPLVTIAGLAHMGLGNVNYAVLISLLVGSAPGIWFGTSLGSRLPTVYLRKILVGVLFAVGALCIWR